MRIAGAVALTVLSLCALVQPAAATPSAGIPLDWRVTPAGTDAQLRGLSAVGHSVAWASGSEGTVLRTVDAGRTWQRSTPPGTDSLEFRDIEAFDEDTAVALSIGPGSDSRIYRTDDGGGSWTPGFVNEDPGAFYDCMSFFDERNGLAMSDPVDGKFRVLSTSDGGASWNVLPSEGMPPALPGEAGFAASGQCLSTHGSADAWIATGGGPRGRVLHSADRGLTWTASETPLPGSESAGVFATAFRDDEHGIAIGGDFAAPDTASHALALTGDGGDTWREPGNAPSGYRSGVSYHPYLPNVLIAVGPSGSDVSVSGGRRWQQFDDGGYDTVDCAGDGACWASGAKGRIGTLTLGR